ncbi:hypothetical protein HMPREF1985_02152 [Mitsuokella sp. oral taxon 131 str. W9106]|nr:hypothetical protein HMPREF1985_02152 [Mitsuokella sp. oral taxon 131 str. W9106]
MQKFCTHTALEHEFCASACYNERGVLTLPCGKGAFACIH